MIGSRSRSGNLIQDTPPRISVSLRNTIQEFRSSVCPSLKVKQSIPHISLSCTSSGLHPAHPLSFHVFFLYASAARRESIHLSSYRSLAPYKASYICLNYQDDFRPNGTNLINPESGLIIIMFLVVHFHGNILSNGSGRLFWSYSSGHCFGLRTSRPCKPHVSPAAHRIRQCQFKPMLEFLLRCGPVIRTDAEAAEAAEARSRFCTGSCVDNNTSQPIKRTNQRPCSGHEQQYSTKIANQQNLLNAIQ